MDKFLKFYHHQDKIIFYSITASAVLAFITLTYFGISFAHLPKFLPLFYSLPWGDDQLIFSSGFLILPFLMLLIGLFNLIVSWHLHSSQLTLKRILNISTLIFSVIISLTAWKIISIF